MIAHDISDCVEEYLEKLRSFKDGWQASELIVTMLMFIAKIIEILEPIIITFIVIYIHRKFSSGNLTRNFWFYIRKIPFVRSAVEQKMKTTTDEIARQLQKGLEEKVYLKQIPEKPWNRESILRELGEYLSLGEYAWEEGYVSGAVYHGGGAALQELVRDVYGRTAYSNPLHPDVFPGVRVMEAEIIRMVAALFNAPRPVGTVTSGGTESIFLVCKAYRDYASFEKGIVNPNMVIPVTAHAAFDKAAQMLKIQVKHVKFDPKTTKVDVKAMKKAIDKNTIMLVGSSPPFPHGCIDPIEEIANLGLQRGIPVHVDACLGGFLLPFMRRAGFPLPPFDFSLEGVTSISVDTHKYAFAPKGTSVILYRDRKYRHHQYSVLPDWPGGIYGTPNMGGSRSGGLVATCWASLLLHGLEGYVDSTRRIVHTARLIAKGLRAVEGLFVFGDPEVSVVAVGSRAFDVYRLSGALSERGWNLNLLQFPAGFHFCVTLQHCAEDDRVALRFLDDVRECTSCILGQPETKATGTAAIYGMAQQIPDRSLVSEIVWAYLDACYDAEGTPSSC